MVTLTSNEQKPAEEATKNAPEIDTYLLFRYTRDAFFKVLKNGLDKSYIVEIRLTEGNKIMIAEADIVVDPAAPDITDSKSYMRFYVDIENMKRLAEYLNTHEHTKLLHIIFGMTKSPVEHVIAITPSESIGDFFVMSKGDRVAKGGRIGIQDPKNGRISVQF